MIDFVCSGTHVCIDFPPNVIGGHGYGLRLWCDQLLGSVQPLEPAPRQQRPQWVFTSVARLAVELRGENGTAELFIFLVVGDT